MALPGLPKTGNDAIDRALAQIERAMAVLDDANIWRNATVLKDVVLTTTAKDVAHGLNRVPQRWAVIDRNANAVVYRSGKATAESIPLKASATVTVTLVIR